MAQSTAEAEFVAATVTVNQALWLRKKLVDLHMKQTQGTEVFVDNQAIIAISHNPVFHGKTKHFNIKLFFLRGVQKDGDINLRYCKTEEQLADIFTNPCQSLSLSFTDKSLEFVVSKARRSVRSLLFGLPRYVLIFQSLNKTESLLVPIL